MRASRTFTAPYEDTRVKRPEFPLTEAVAWYLEDARGQIVDTTWETYRCHLRQFINWLPASSRTIASVEPETVERFVRSTASNANTRRNKTIALKSCATYLAKKKLWYMGSEDARLSVLRDVKAQQPSAKGMPGYSDAELVAMVHAVAVGPNRLRNVAVLWTLFHGFRAKEVRLMPLRRVVMPKYGERGEFIIEAESEPNGELTASAPYRWSRWHWSRSANTSGLAVRRTSGQGMSPCFSPRTAARSAGRAGPQWRNDSDG